MLTMQVEYSARDAELVKCDVTFNDRRCRVRIVIYSAMPLQHAPIPKHSARATGLANTSNIVSDKRTSPIF